MNKSGDTVVLQNRLSWNSFEKVRKSQGLIGRKRKGVDENREEGSASKRKHGRTSSSLNIDKEQLLNEARTWQPDQPINWSQLGLRYGLSMGNCGQVIKEHLAEQGIIAAQRKQRTQRAQCRLKKYASQVVKCLSLCISLC